MFRFGEWKLWPLRDQNTAKNVSPLVTLLKYKQVVKYK